jgi:hypothetical protein
MPVIIQRQYAESVFVQSLINPGINDQTIRQLAAFARSTRIVRRVGDAGREESTCYQGYAQRAALHRHLSSWRKCKATWDGADVSTATDCASPFTTHVSNHKWHLQLTKDVCAAFAASFLLRIARLFPLELNLKKTAKDVEELAKVLAEGLSSACG